MYITVVVGSSEGVDRRKVMIRGNGEGVSGRSGRKCSILTLHVKNL